MNWTAFWVCLGSFFGSIALVSIPVLWRRKRRAR